jgi:DNA-binding MarR family transcriptional regulator
MSLKDDENGLSYADKAFIALNEIMSSKQKNMLDNVNRANKGELFVLQFLLMSNTEVLPSELSAALNASTARISALLGALEKKGQIVRNIDKNNRRNILVNITEAGRNRAETEMEEIKSRMTRVFTDMGKEDTTEFIRLTGQFFELLQKYMPQ